MVVLANEGMFRGGIYSTRSPNVVRLVGKSMKHEIVTWKTQRPKGGKRGRDGVWRWSATPPFLPDKASDHFHLSGNSLGYGIQWAMIMGANPIYLLGFTCKSGSGYDWGTQNPVTKRSSLYTLDLLEPFCRWIEKKYPGRVRLFPGWEGPVYDWFRTEGDA